MPATRLNPITFPEPERVARWIEEDAALLEGGLRIVARSLPIPAAGGPHVADLLALDVDHRPVIILVRETLEAHDVTSASASRDWLGESVPTLRALCPALADARADARLVLIASQADSAAVLIAAGLGPPRPEILRAAVFDARGETAIILEPLHGTPGPVRPRTGDPRGRAESRAAGAPEIVRADPLTGIPLTAEEVEEFRRLTPRHPSRATGGKTPAPRPFSEDPVSAVTVEN